MARRRNERTPRQHRLISEFEKQQEARSRALAEAFVASELADEMASYLNRGRTFRAVGEQELRSQWTAVTKLWIAQRDQADQIRMDDLSAEFRLRNLEVPWDTVKAEMAEAREEIRIGAFLRERDRGN
jgi:hypothetical protein